jgi:hypothetical protein
MLLAMLGRVGDCEVAANALGGHPGIQRACCVHVVVDGGFLEGAALPVVGGPQVIGEVGQGQRLRAVLNSGDSRRRCRSCGR